MNARRAFTLVATHAAMTASKVCTRRSQFRRLKRRCSHRVEITTDAKIGGYNNSLITRLRFGIVPNFYCIDE
jgi:hypothetical protein